MTSAMAFDSTPAAPGNRLLAQLPAHSLAQLAPHMREVQIKRGEPICSAGERIERIYFIQSGIASIVSVLTGTAVETSAVGREGAVNLVAAMGTGRSSTNIVMQVEGSASCVDAERWRDAAHACASIRDLTARYTQALLGQALQSVACSTLHTVEARLCRKLLSCRDRTGDDLIPLTQEFLAKMLGVQRSTLAAVAHKMQEAKLIRYKRGLIRIVDLVGLRREACECYGVIRSQYRELLPGTWDESVTEGLAPKGR